MEKKELGGHPSPKWLGSPILVEFRKPRSWGETQAIIDELSSREVPELNLCITDRHEKTIHTRHVDPDYAWFVG